MSTSSIPRIISQGVLHFYTTEVRLNKPNKLNDVANTCFSYVHYFTGKELIQYKDGKVERILPNKVDDAYPWIPSAVKSGLYFIAAIPCLIIGTWARILSLDSPEIRQAVFADRATLQSPAENSSNPSDKVLSSGAHSTAQPPSTKTAGDPTKSHTSIPLKNPPNPTVSVPSSSPKSPSTKEPRKTEREPSYEDVVQRMKEVYKDPVIKSQTEATLKETLNYLFSFYKELLKHRGNFKAIISFIDEQRRDPSYSAPFFLRDYFLIYQISLNEAGIKLDEKDLAEWEELDGQCDDLMSDPNLKDYLAEECPPQARQQMTETIHQTKKNMDREKENMKLMIKNNTLFFESLLSLLQQSPPNPSTLMSLLYPKNGNLPHITQIFSTSKMLKCFRRFMPEVLDKPPYSGYLTLYSECCQKLRAAGFIIPSVHNLGKIATFTPPPAAPSRSTKEISIVDRLTREVKFLQEMVTQEEKNLKEWLEKNNSSNDYPLLWAKKRLSKIKDYKEVDSTIRNTWRYCLEACTEKLTTPELKLFIDTTQIPKDASPELRAFLTAV